MKQSFNTLNILLETHFPDSNIWEGKIDLLDESQHGKIEALIVEAQKLFQSKSIETYLDFEKAFLQDINSLKSKNSGISITEFINYLQLSIFTNSIGFFNMKGLFSYSYDSIVYSVNDSNVELGEDLTIYDNRLFRFRFSDNMHVRINSISLIVEWLKHFYYCSFSSGALPKFGYDFWHIAKMLSLDSKRFDSERLVLISNLLSWNSQYKVDDDFETEVSKFLLNKFSILDWTDDLKIDVCTQLILLQAIPNSKRTRLYYQLIKQVELQQHVKLQLLVSIISDFKDYKQLYKPLLYSISKYNSFLEKEINNKILKAYQRARIFKILNRLLILLGVNGKTTALTKIIGNFYDVSRGLENSILYIFPTFERGVLYCANSKVEIIRKDTFKLTKELILLSNKLFNRTWAFLGDKEDIYIPKDLMGKPNVHIATQYEAKIIELYSFNIIKEKFNKKINGMLQLSFNSIPIQALMLKQIGFTYPISTSLSKPLKEAKKKKLLIWSFGSFTSYYEEITLKYLCDEYELDYDYVEQENVTKETFLECYKSNRYSIIWVASHGEYNNFEPHKSLINISENEIVTLEELVEKENSDSYNRLLVLNLCESGINSDSGGFRGLGFGHQLVSAKQSIISHLWMVEPRIAMTFGIILAIELLAYENSYFDAYKYAVSSLLNGKEYVLNLLNDEIGELQDVIERVENTDNVDWTNILTWGSAAFYQ